MTTISGGGFGGGAGSVTSMIALRDALVDASNQGAAHALGRAPAHYVHSVPQSGKTMMSRVRNAVTLGRRLGRGGSGAATTIVTRVFLDRATASKAPSKALPPSVSFVDLGQSILLALSKREAFEKVLWNVKSTPGVYGPPTESMRMAADVKKLFEHRDRMDFAVPAGFTQVPIVLRIWCDGGTVINQTHIPVVVRTASPACPLAALSLPPPPACPLATLSHDFPLFCSLRPHASSRLRLQIHCQAWLRRRISSS